MFPSLRSVTIEALGGIKKGSHICVFYAGLQDLLDVMVAFVRTSLSENPFVWVTPNDISVRVAEQVMIEAISNMPEFSEKGRIQIRPREGWYLRHGVFDKKLAVGSLMEKLSEALADGHEALRFSGDIARMESKESKRFLKYEKDLQFTIEKNPMIVLCTYSFRQWGIDELMNVVRRHESVLLKRNNKWECIPSTQMKAAKDALRAAYRELQEQVEEKSGQLQKLADVSLALNSALSVDEILQLLTDKAREIIGAHQAVASSTINQNWAQSIDAISMSDKYEDYSDFHEKPDGSGIYAMACELGRPVRMTQHELESHPRWKGFGKHAGMHPPLRGWLAVPLTARDGKNLGLIQLSVKYEGDFTTDDEAILVQLAQIASIAIENKRLLESERQSRKLAEERREQLRQLSKRLVEVQESERRKIARELHDEIGQQLTGIKMRLESLEKESEGSEAQEHANVKEMVNELMERVRDLSLNLRPTMLDDLGLLPALLWLIDRYSSQMRIQVDFKHVNLRGKRFSIDTETAAYRLVQEALTNIARHSGAKEAHVSIQLEEDWLHISIEDHGRGFNVDSALQSNTTSGLSGMIERAKLLGGRILIDSGQDKGTMIGIELPATSPARSKVENP